MSGASEPLGSLFSHAQIQKSDPSCEVRGEGLHFDVHKPQKKDRRSHDHLRQPSFPVSAIKGSKPSRGTTPNPAHGQTEAFDPKSILPSSSPPSSSGLIEKRPVKAAHRPRRRSRRTASSSRPRTLRPPFPRNVQDGVLDRRNGGSTVNPAWERIGK